MAESEMQNLLEFFHLAENLKKEKRKGWVERGVQDSESVADHSFRLALMALVFAERQGLNADKAVKMALLHDLPEAIVGDVISRPGDESNEELRKEKHCREEKAMKEILANLDKGLAGEFMALWQEFEERDSEEARLVFELDRLEATLQAEEYVKNGLVKARVQTFIDYANSRLRNQELKDFFGQLLEEMQGKG